MTIPEHKFADFNFELCLKSSKQNNPSLSLTLKKPIENLTLYAGLFLGDIEGRNQTKGIVIKVPVCPRKPTDDPMVLLWKIHECHLDSVDEDLGSVAAAYVNQADANTDTANPKTKTPPLTRATAEQINTQKIINLFIHWNENLRDIEETNKTAVIHKFKEYAVSDIQKEFIQLSGKKMASEFLNSTALMKEHTLDLAQKLYVINKAAENLQPKTDSRSV